MQMRLLADTDTNTHVDLPSGKISKSGAYKRVRRQQGMTCTLFALRRISIFNTADKKNSYLLAYKKMKSILANYTGDFAEMVTLAKGIFEDLGISIHKEIEKNQSFGHMCQKIRFTRQISKSNSEIFNLMSAFDQWIVLYDIFIEHVLKPLMNIRNADWHPRDGFKGLQETLKKNGALFFMGKFGTWCYSDAPLEFKSETTQNRHVFYFNKKSYVGDTKPFTHGIIVDQVKVVNGKQMVFFRDPNFLSSKTKAEKIFMLSYETFVERLTDLQGHRFSQQACSSEATFGLASAKPEKLYGLT